MISGDIHHYERIRIGSSQHITAGGGGAFLHPSLPDPRPQKDRLFNSKTQDDTSSDKFRWNPDVCQWPTVEQSKSLVSRSTQSWVHSYFKKALLFCLGVDSGWIPHTLIFGAYFVPMMFPKDLSMSDHSSSSNINTNNSNDNTSSSSYHMIMISKCLFPQPVVSLFSNDACFYLFYVCSLFYLSGSWKSLRGVFESSPRAANVSFGRSFVGDPEFPYLWIAVLLSPQIDGLVSFLLRLSVFVQADDSSRNVHIPAEEQDENYLVDIFKISFMIVFCVVFWLTQFLISFKEVRSKSCCHVLLAPCLTATTPDSEVSFFTENSVLFGSLPFSGLSQCMYSACILKSAFSLIRILSAGVFCPMVGWSFEWAH